MVGREDDPGGGTALGEGIRPHGGGGRVPGLIRALILRAAGRLLDVLLPRTCPGCGEYVPEPSSTGLHLCRTCSATVILVPSPVCPSCGLPVQAPGICRACSLSPPVYEAACAPFVYGGATKSVVLSLKYGGAFELARPMGRMMAATVVRRGFTGCTAVVPVPLSGPRLHARSYNQSCLLAFSVGKALGLPVLPDLLRKVRDPGPQGGHGRQERLARVRGCFSAAPSPRVQGARLLLVDDVIATGATVSECSRVLGEAGADSVLVVAYAMSVPGM